MTSGQSDRGRGHRVELPILGTVLIAIGVIALLNAFDVIDTSVWWVMWRLWPLLLILLGIKVIFGRMRPVAVALISAGSVIAAVAFAWAVSEGDLLSADQVRTEYDLPRGGFEQMELDVDFGAGKLTVLPLEPGDTRLLHADFLDDEDAVEVSGPGTDTTAQVKLSMNNDGFPAFLRSRADDREWTLYIARDVPARITVDGGAGEFRLDFSQLQVSSFDISIGAASLEVTAPASAGSVEGQIGAGASNITVNVPAGVEARISNGSGVSSVDIDEDRFPNSDGTHESVGYETATNRLDVEIDAGVSRIEVR